MMAVAPSAAFAPAAADSHESAKHTKAPLHMPGLRICRIVYTLLTCPTRPTCPLLILQRLHKGTAHRRFRGPNRCHQRGAQHRRDECRGHAERERVVESHAGDIMLDDLQGVVQ